MNWVAAGGNADRDGIKSMKPERASMLVEGSFRKLDVRLLEPLVEACFKDTHSNAGTANKEFTEGAIAQLESSFKARLAQSSTGIAATEQERTHWHEPNELHDTLDAIVSRAYAFIASKCHTTDQATYADLRLLAEEVTYVASVYAQRSATISIDVLEWNTFRAVIENRMLELRDDGNQQSAFICTPDCVQAFASFVSTRWKRMEDLEALLDSQGTPAVAQRLAEEPGPAACSADEISQLIQDLSECARRLLLPKIVSMFQ